MEPVSASAVAETPAKAPKRAKLPKKERDTSDHPMPKREPIPMPALGSTEKLPTNTNLVQSVESPLDKDYLEALQFNEEPLSIIIAPSPEKFAPKHVECWVNGKGIEVLIGNRWIEFKAIPVGKTVVTKRKYVEVLLRMKRMDVTNKIIEHPNEDPQNVVTRDLATVHGITIRHDPSPKGAEWFNRMVSLEG